MNRRMPNGTYGGVRGTETKVGQKTFVSRPTRLCRGALTFWKQKRRRMCGILCLCFAVPNYFSSFAKEFFIAYIVTSNRELRNKQTNQNIVSK